MPLRTCIVCRRKANQNLLVRIRRAPEGPTIETSHGRSAYVCAAGACTGGMTLKRLERALRCQVSDAEFDALKAALAAVVT